MSKAKELGPRFAGMTISRDWTCGCGFLLSQLPQSANFYGTVENTKVAITGKWSEG